MMKVKEFLYLYSIDFLLFFICKVIKDIYDLNNTKYFILDAVVMTVIFIYRSIIKDYLEYLKYKYDKVLFNHLIQGNLDALKSYVKDKYKDVKALENVYCYVKFYFLKTF
jgi:hypothetical protein